MINISWNLMNNDINSNNKVLSYKFYSTLKKNVCYY